MKYQEIGGSPKEQYDRVGFSATRQFLIPWSERENFVEHVIGNCTVNADPPSTVAISNSLAYPGKCNTHATKLVLEPLDSTAITSGVLGDVQTELADYKGSFLKATIHYESISGDRNDTPEVQSGSWITYKLITTATEEELDASGWKWEDNSALQVPNGYTVIKRIPVSEHRVTWHQVSSPPWLKISELQGKVNDSEFLGCAPGTLLFDGAESYKLFRKDSTITDEPSAFTWQIMYNFREKAVKADGNVYGWNSFYRASPPGWVKLLHDQKLVYDSGNFNLLFISENE
ncbi:MAG: hypothetical protein ACRC2T_03980 [Thermoguttaceae bacterium]